MQSETWLSILELPIIHRFYENPTKHKQFQFDENAGISEVRPETRRKPRRKASFETTAIAREW